MAMHLLKSVFARTVSQLSGGPQSHLLAQLPAIPRLAGRLTLARQSSPSAAPGAKVACRPREFVEMGLDSQVTYPALDASSVRKLAGSLRRRNQTLCGLAPVAGDTSSKHLQQSLSLPHPRQSRLGA